MNRYIENLVNGAYEYDAGRLLFSEKRIEMNCAAGEDACGTLSIRTTDEKNAHIKILTSTPRIKTSVSVFDGPECNIVFEVTTRGLETGDVIKGEIILISDMGEYIIPVTVSIIRMHLLSSLGDIRNLFHFTNLARTDFDEAVRIFYSEDFGRIFESSENSEYEKYRAFSVVKGLYANVDEFLIAVNKKTPVVYNFMQENVMVRKPAGDVHGEVQVNRTGWGYSAVSMSADEDFIRLEKTDYSEDDFLGNILHVRYDIIKERLHEGKNFGSIRLKSQHTDISIPVFVYVPAIPENIKRKHIELGKLNMMLTSEYIKFRIHELSSASWIQESMNIVDRMLALDNKNIEARLFQVQLLISSGRYDEAGFILERVNGEYDIMSKAPALRAYFLYLTALYSDDHKVIKNMADKVNEIYAGNKNSDRLLWILIYLDEGLKRSPMRELDMLEKQFEKGSTSPLIYIEAYRIFSDDPTMLSKLSDFELQTMMFATRYGLMNKDIEGQLISLASRMRHYSVILFKIMTAFYEEFEDDEMLAAICTLLIRGEKDEHRYFQWYEKAVGKELRITNLYEFYIYSMPPGRTELLPKSVLMYFGFENNISFRMKAFVYANMIVHENDVPEMLRSYYPQIELFARREILSGHIDENLTVIYDHIRIMHKNDEMSREKAAFDEGLVKLAFKKHVVCHSQKMKYVIVVEEQFIGETKTELVNGEAYPDIYSSDYEIIFEDAEGKRYSKLDNGYDIVKLLDPADLISECRQYGGDIIGICVFLSEGSRHFITITKDNAEYVRRIVDSPDISHEYKEDIRQNLLQFYYDKNMFSELDEFIGKSDMTGLKSKERSEIIHFMIVRDMGDRAYNEIMTYGAENVAPKVLVRIASHRISEYSDDYDEGLLYIAHTAFAAGKYDEIVLQYLIRYFEGTTRAMRDVWKAGMSFETDVFSIEERIIIQMLVTRSFVGEEHDIFEDYISSGASSTVKLAYLSYNAYEYFIKERIMDDRIFGYLLQEYGHGTELNDICMLALINFYSDRERDESTTEVLKVFIRNMLRRGVIFDFFRKYRKDVPELSMFDDITVIEYRTNPRNRVVLHFVTADNESEGITYEKEDMANIYGGIFSRHFVLFYGDTVQYYITEEVNGKENLTSSGLLECGDVSLGEHDSRYNMINDMLVARSMRDTESFDDIITQYIRKLEITDSVFSVEQEP